MPGRDGQTPVVVNNFERKISKTMTRVMLKALMCAGSYQCWIYCSASPPRSNYSLSGPVQIQEDTMYPSRNSKVTTSCSSLCALSALISGKIGKTDNVVDTTANSARQYWLPQGFSRVKQCGMTEMSSQAMIPRATRYT